MIRACAYVRVSTAKQAKEGLSLDEQQRAAEAHIEAQGWEHAGTFIEAGVSGRRDDRPQLAKVLESSNGLDVLVIPKLDRLGRSTRHLLDTVERLEANGVRLVSLKDHLDTSTPSGRLLLRVLASVAEFESDMIGERVASVTAARAEQGKAHGRPRYGYRSGEDGWELVPALAQVVVRVFTEYAEDGLSQREIARRLNGEGQRRPDGGPWTQTNVGKVLASPVYVGRVRVNGQTYDGAHEAIISEELWEKAEALRTAHARTRKGKTPTAEHILSGGMLRCGQCGGSMGAETRRYRNGRVAGTYTCSTRAHHGLDACPQTSVKQQLIDEAVFTFVTETAFDLDATRRELIGRAGRELADEKTFSHQADRDRAKAQERLARVRRDYTDGTLDVSDWIGFRDELTSELEAASRKYGQSNSRLSELEAARGQIDAESQVLEAMTRLRASILGQARESGAPGAALRIAIRRLFVSFELIPQGSFGCGNGYASGIPWPSEDHDLTAGGYWLVPRVRPEALEPAPKPWAIRRQALGGLRGLEDSSLVKGSAMSDRRCGVRDRYGELGEYAS